MKEAMFLERLAESLLEGGLSRVLKARLEPVQIAKALGKEMDRSKVVAPNAPLVANRYRVFLHPDDLVGFAGFQASVEREIALYLADYARRRGFKPLSSPEVRFLPASPPGKLGAMRVEASLVDPEPQPEPQSSLRVLRPERELTAEMPVVLSPDVAAAERQPAQLVDEAGHAFPLTRAATSLGRAVDNDIVLEDRDVSRYHARILWEAGRYVLVDQGSTNGTFVAGQRIERREMSGGEEIALGRTRFTFRLAEH